MCSTSRSPRMSKSHPTLSWMLNISDRYSVSWSSWHMRLISWTWSHCASVENLHIRKESICLRSITMTMIAEGQSRFSAVRGAKHLFMFNMTSLLFINNEWLFAFFCYHLRLSFSSRPVEWTASFLSTFVHRQTSMKKSDHLRDNLAWQTAIFFRLFQLDRSHFPRDKRRRRKVLQPETVIHLILRPWFSCISSVTADQMNSFEAINTSS